MRTNPRDSAFSRPATFEPNGGECDLGENGLTKREYFAAMAIQGTIAANDHTSPIHLTQEIASLHAKAAVILADALIAELNKN
jgi:hypothetical protein